MTLNRTHLLSGSFDSMRVSTSYFSGKYLQKSSLEVSVSPSVKLDLRFLVEVLWAFFVISEGDLKEEEEVSKEDYLHQVFVCLCRSHSLCKICPT